ncbi:MAG: PKD domain-containing protein [Saprospiraceae bacterium]|nr:PKD domain-containing protein [Saprospiraceae bacterium]
MKKNLFFTLICLLLAGWVQAQNLVTVFGTVTLASDGSAVDNQPVFLMAGDSLNPIFGDGVTGQDGYYEISVDLPNGVTDVTVSTFSFCNPNGLFDEIVADVSSGQAIVDFQLCDDSFPPPPDCFIYFEIVPVDTLTLQFIPVYFSSLDSNATGVSYLWDFGDGTSSTEESPTHTFAQNGFYLITLTVTGSDGCVATATFPLETGFSGFPECMGYILYDQISTTTFEFDAEIYDTDGNLIQANSYDWDFGDGQSSTEVNPTHTYADEGVYTVVLHAVTDDSCEIHACDVVFAYDCTVDTFLYGCQAMFAPEIDPLGNPLDSLTISFVDLSLGAVTSWSWDFGDGTTSDEQNPTHTYAQGGVYVVTLAIVTLDGCESEISFEICIGNGCWIPEFDCQALFIPLADSSNGSGLGIQFLDLSFALSPIQSWTWDFGDGTTSSEQNPYHVYTQAGVFEVSLTIEADSCNSTISFEFDTEDPWNFNRGGNLAQLGQSPQSVATKEALPSFDAAKTFPNPASTELSVAFNSRISGDYQLIVTDLSGKTLISTNQQAVEGLNYTRLNIADLAPGLYLASIKAGDSVQTLKFVKQQ